MQNLAIDLLRIDGGTQLRAAIVQEAVDSYAEAYLAKAVLPDLVVYFDGVDYWLSNGFHRLHGARKAGRSAINCHVIPGTQREAVLYAAGANHDQGLRRTNADKRKAVGAVLADPEWSQKSDRWIASMCKVDDKTVSQVRKSAPDKKRSRKKASDAKNAQQEGSETEAKKEPEETREGQDGKQYKKPKNGRQKSDPRQFKQVKDQMGKTLRLLDDLHHETPNVEQHRLALQGIKQAMDAVEQWRTGRVA